MEGCVAFDSVEAEAVVPVAGEGVEDSVLDSVEGFIEDEAVDTVETVVEVGDPLGSVEETRDEALVPVEEVVLSELDGVGVSEVSVVPCPAHEAT